MSTIYEKSLQKHSEWKGKLEIKLKEPLNNKDDLSIAYCEDSRGNLSQITIAI